MKRNMKKVAMMGVATMLLLGGCGSDSNEKGDKKETVENEDFELVSQSKVDGYQIRIIKHKEKEWECKYILTTGNSTTIEPLLGPDNKIMCDKKE